MTPPRAALQETACPTSLSQLPLAPPRGAQRMESPVRGQAPRGSSACVPLARAGCGPPLHCQHDASLEAHTLKALPQRPCSPFLLLWDARVMSLTWYPCFGP